MNYDFSDSYPSAQHRDGQSLTNMGYRNSTYVGSCASSIGTSNSIPGTEFDPIRYDGYTLPATRELDHSRISRSVRDREDRSFAKKVRVQEQGQQVARLSYELRSKGSSQVQEPDHSTKECHFLECKKCRDYMKLAVAQGVDAKIKKISHFRNVGSGTSTSIVAPVSGTNYYTADSNLASMNMSAANVNAGQEAGTVRGAMEGKEGFLSIDKNTFVVIIVVIILIIVAILVIKVFFVDKK